MIALASKALGVTLVVIAVPLAYVAIKFLSLLDDLEMADDDWQGIS